VQAIILVMPVALACYLTPKEKKNFHPKNKKQQKENNL
jgi:hypothetical protein